MNAETNHRFIGCLLGTAVGDAIGLPAEGISRGRIERCWPGPWRHRFLFGRGMISDDTEHTLFVAQALLAHADNVAAFERSLAWKLRLWLLGAPAGVGFATLRATLKLWLGFPASRSGVFSAGNAPAMRAAIIGAYFADQPERLVEFVHAATRLTHTDPKAEIAARAVAQAAAWVTTHDGNTAGFIETLMAKATDDVWRNLIRQLQSALAKGISVSEFASALGLEKGVSGYCYHTVPVALYAWLRHRGDFRLALESVIRCGGDTDTVGAITGALCGVTAGAAGIPADWLEGLVDWPRSRSLLERVGLKLASQKAGGQPLGPVHYFWPGLLLRNLLFLLIVLTHGFRRLAPPY